MLAIYFTMDVLAIECLVGGTAANQRTSNKCESAGGSEAGSIPINGVCKARDSSEEVANVGCKKASANKAGDQTCGKCEGDTYFLYKGGCYSIGDTTGQKLCTTAATEGVCTVAALDISLFRGRPRWISPSWCAVTPPPGSQLEEASSCQSKLREIWHPKFRMPVDSGGGGLLGE